MLDSTRSYDKDYFNSYNIIQNLELKIKEQINQLNPKSSRQKRGIINGLGSIVKCLTGNLDQEDAEKYDTQISQLQTNQNKFKIILENQVSLLNSSINSFNELAHNISQNRETLRSRILEIEGSIKNMEQHQLDSYNYFKTHMMLFQITTIYQTIYTIFDKIEIAISFSKLNTLHNSIVKPNELLSELKDVQNYLSDVKLPFEPSLENILSFENVINIKSYSKNHEIIFILEIPLVELNTYQYYQLYPFPIKNNNSFQMILPKNDYIAINEHNFVPSNDKCKEISTEEFMCSQVNTIKINENSPCEVSLLIFSKDINNCYPLPVNINEYQIQKIVNEKLIVIAPQPLVAIQQCRNMKDNIPLFGSYVIDLDTICTINIENHILRTYKNSKVNFKNINLPKLKLNLNNSNNKLSTYNPGAFNLNLINTHQLLKTQKDLEYQKNELHKLNNPVYVSKTSIWTIILYLIFVIVILYLIYVKYISKLKNRNSNSKEVDSNIII